MWESLFVDGGGNLPEILINRRSQAFYKLTDVRSVAKL